MNLLAVSMKTSGRHHTCHVLVHACYRHSWNWTYQLPAAAVESPGVNTTVTGRCMRPSHALSSVPAPSPPTPGRPGPAQSPVTHVIGPIAICQPSQGASYCKGCTVHSWPAQVPTRPKQLKNRHTLHNTQRPAGVARREAHKLVAVILRFDDRVGGAGTPRLHTLLRLPPQPACTAPYSQRAAPSQAGPRRPTPTEAVRVNAPRWDPHACAHRALRVVDRRLVRGHHVLDVDERVVAALLLKQRQRVGNELTQAVVVALPVVDAVAQVLVLVLVQVEDGQDLAVVGHQRLAHQVSAQHQLLQQLQRDAHHAVVARVERRLDGDDELRDDGQDLGASRLEHVLHALDRQEAVRLLRLADAVKKDGQVVVVVQLLNLHLPGNDVLGAAVVHRDGQVAALVEAAERGVGRVVAPPVRARLGRRGPRLGAVLVQPPRLDRHALALAQEPRLGVRPPRAEPVGHCALRPYWQLIFIDVNRFMCSSSHW
mmetsp:Transcript_2172/g.5516  ORF Transcript_2172/g.5516 Transcript_2172/m.5516 type:complete len:483 (-) Transcript_2172:226-1674(-)